MKYDHLFLHLPLCVFLLFFPFKTEHSCVSEVSRYLLLKFLAPTHLRWRVQDIDYSINVPLTVFFGLFGLLLRSKL